jgi:hypothetical protein
MSAKHMVSQVNHATFFTKIYKHSIHNTNITLIAFGIQIRQESKQGDSQGQEGLQKEVPIKFITPFQGPWNG